MLGWEDPLAHQDPQDSQDLLDSLELVEQRDLKVCVQPAQGGRSWVWKAVFWPSVSGRQRVTGQLCMGKSSLLATCRHQLLEMSRGMAGKGGALTNGCSRRVKLERAAGRVSMEGTCVKGDFTSLCAVFPCVSGFSYVLYCPWSIST